MFGDHAAFIIPAYLISLVVLAATAVTISMAYRRRRKELADLEGVLESHAND